MDGYLDCELVTIVVEKKEMWFCNPQAGHRNLVIKHTKQTLWNAMKTLPSDHQLGYLYTLAIVYVNNA